MGGEDRVASKLGGLPKTSNLLDSSVSFFSLDGPLLIVTFCATFTLPSPVPNSFPNNDKPADADEICAGLVIIWLWELTELLVAAPSGCEVIVILGEVTVVTADLGPNSAPFVMKVVVSWFG